MISQMFGVSEGATRRLPGASKTHLSRLRLRLGPLTSLKVHSRMIGPRTTFSHAPKVLDVDVLAEPSPKKDQLARTRNQNREPG